MELSDYAQLAIDSTDPLPKPDKSTFKGQYELAMAIYEAHNTGGRAGARMAYERDILPLLPRRRRYRADELNQLPEPSWLIKDELPANGLTILFGASGAGKSFQALDYAEQVAQDKAVLYIAAEGASGYRARITALQKRNQRQTGKLYFWIEPLNMLDEGHVEEFIRENADLEVGLVVIDTLARCMVGGDENSAKDMGLFVQACNRLQTAMQTAVLVVHHTGKSGTSERGSSALRGAADMMIELKNDDGLIRISCEKSKDSAGFETRHMRLVQMADSCVLMPSDKIVLDENILSNNEKTIIEFLADREVFDNGAKSQIIIRATGLPDSSFYRTIKLLNKRGLVRKEGKFDPWVLTEKGYDVAERYGLFVNSQYLSQNSQKVSGSSQQETSSNSHTP